LSVLLRELKDQVRVIVGTSAGALISAYLVANWHRSVEEAIEDGLRFWREFAIWGRVRAADGAWRRGSVHALHRRVSSSQQPSRAVGAAPRTERTDARKAGGIRSARRERPSAAGGARSGRYPSHSNLSVVFHQGGVPRHADDPLRGIESIATRKLGAEHVLASAAIPALFPAVRVRMPERASGWYFDGGPRLNTPIKPALWLGAERVIVIALNSVAPSRTAPPDQQPDFYVGAAHLLHAALGDPLSQDIRTLANRNALIEGRLAAERQRSVGVGLAEREDQSGGPDEPVQPVPYIFIAPQDPSAIGEIARRVYSKHYRRPWRAGARDLVSWCGLRPVTRS
jgi:NTE family protein